MKNTLKTLGIICIIAAATFITSCGPGVEADPIVTFDANGGTLVGPSTVTVKSGEPVSEPTQPKAPTSGSGNEPTEAGFFKLATTVSAPPTFKEWQLNGAKYDFSTPVTSDITLKAAWNYGSGGEPTKLDSQLSASDGANILEQVVAYLAKDTTANGTNDKYILVLGTNITASKQIYLRRGNLKIKSSSFAQRTITGFTPTGTANAANVTNGSNHVAFLIGDSNAPTGTTIAPTLTLNNIELKGIGTEVGDSLVRIRKSATLILDDSSAVRGHKNSATVGDGLNGNGSAVCVAGANLTIKQGSVIEGNESTKNGAVVGSGTNRNRVGGVYTIKDGVGPTLIIEGGSITDNECTEGNTKDLYATEGGTFTLSGATTIGELTINADPDTAAAVPATIIVSGLLNNVGKLSLRSTGPIANVKTAWTGKHVLLGPGSTATNSVDPAASDVAKFSLGDFKGNAGFEAIAGYSISEKGVLTKNP